MHGFNSVIERTSTGEALADICDTDNELEYFDFEQEDINV